MAPTPGRPATRVRRWSPTAVTGPWRSVRAGLRERRGRGSSPVRAAPRRCPHADSGTTARRPAHTSAAHLPVRRDARVLRWAGLRQRHPDGADPMHRRLWALTLALLATAGCYRSHVRRDSGAAADAGALDADVTAPDAPSSSDGAGLLDVPHCISGPPSWGSRVCPPDGDAQCREWALQASLGRGMHSLCRDGSCTIGDFCDDLGCRCSVTDICARGWACIDVAGSEAPICHLACGP